MSQQALFGLSWHVDSNEKISLQRHARPIRKRNSRTNCLSGCNHRRLPPCFSNRSFDYETKKGFAHQNKWY